MTTAAGETGGEATRPRRCRRSLTPGRRVLIVVLSLLALLVAGGGIYLATLATTYQQNVTTLPDVFPDETSRPAPVEGTAASAMNILLVGSDTRGDLGSNEIDDVSPSLADVIMVAHISADRQSVQVMSIPRDSWVEQPNGSMGKINWSFASEKGPAGLVETVEKLIDVRIDHVAAIDFEGFKGMTDALGGVTVNNTVEWQRRGEYFGIGPVELDGERALMFVRERKLTGSDLVRVTQQQEYLRALLSKVLSAGTLTDPAKVFALTSAITPYLAVDPGLDAPRVASLAAELREIRSGDISFFTMPTDGSAWIGDQWAVLVDPVAISEVAEAFRTDSVIRLAQIATGP